MATKQYKIEIDMPSYPVGSIHDVEFDADGIAVNQFWRRRIEDSKQDNCVSEVVKPSKSAAKAEA